MTTTPASTTTGAAAALPSNSKDTCWLRVIQINDVYELDNLPCFRTLVTELSAVADTTLVICAGDFLAPSLLSSLDKGAAMVDCFLAAGVTHVSLGNHEADVPLDALKQRILQSQQQQQQKSDSNNTLTWINTNLRELDSILSVTTSEYCIVDVTSPSGNVSKKVALLGLLTHDPGLYRPGAFGEGTIIQPIMESTTAILETLSQQEDSIDFILPLTHQSMADDRAFGEHFGGDVFPIICGGHEHEVYEEVVNGCRILKAGMDAVNAFVIDIQWDNSNCNDTKPTIQVELIPTANFAPDAGMLQRVQGHQRVLRELERARLFRITDWMSSKHNNGDNKATNETSKNNDQETEVVFSTLNNRLGPSTGTTAICTMLRMGMRAQCAIINAGAIRANKIYDHRADNNAYFTWSDLKAEIPFETGMTVCYLPGRVLEETIRHSRAGAQQQPPAASGGYLHTCSNIQFCDIDNDALGSCSIASIQGQPFDPEKLYLTALPMQFFEGIDNHQPLLDWAAAAREGGDDTMVWSEESAIPAKMVLVQVFSATMWLQLGSFDEIDRNHDGVLCRDEVKARVAAVYGHDSVADLIVDNIFSVADMNQDGTITPLEMMIVEFVATDIFDHVCTQQELATMKEVAAQVLGKDPSHAEVKVMVKKIRDTVDPQGNGKINRSEVMKALGTLQRSDLLQ